LLLTFQRSHPGPVPKRTESAVKNSEAADIA